LFALYRLSGGGSSSKLHSGHKHNCLDTSHQDKTPLSKTRPSILTLARALAGACGWNQSILRWLYDQYEAFDAAYVTADPMAIEVVPAQGACQSSPRISTLPWG